MSSVQNRTLPGLPCAHRADCYAVLWLLHCVTVCMPHLQCCVCCVLCTQCRVCCVCYVLCVMCCVCYVLCRLCVTNMCISVIKSGYFGNLFGNSTNDPPFYWLISTAKCLTFLVYPCYNVLYIQSKGWIQL